MDKSGMIKLLSEIDLTVLALLGTTAIAVMFSLCSRCTVKKQKRDLLKMDELLKLQSEGNHHLHALVNEARRNNRLLSELVAMGPEEYVEETAPTLQPLAAEQPSVDSQHKLYVGNIDYLATEAELGTYFGQCGQVEFVNIPVNRYTGKARGFGFVTFVSKEDAESAMSLHGTEFKGRQIQVNFAKERESAQ